MVRFTARLLALVVALAPLALLSSVAAPAGAVVSGSSADQPVVRTLTGHVERYAAVLRRGGDRTRWELDTGTHVYRLDPQGTRLVPGARMAVTGTVDGDVVHVRSARVLATTGDRTGDGAGVRARGTSSTRILVMRVYWTAAPPARPTTTDTKAKVVTRADSWFRTVSGGRYSVSGSVTPWLKITRPGSCTGDTSRVMDHALARAKARGYNPSGFGRWIVYLPCSGGGITGLGSLPGKRIWLFDTVDLGTNVHEQGHNLGLEHANLRTCSAGGTRVSWSSSCTVREYSDWSDAMGNGPAAHYSAINKRKLGWLSSSTVVAGDTTRTLTPLDESSGGLKGLGVRTSDRTYWVELRSGANEDSGIPVPCRGLQVRFNGGGGTQAIDLLPGNPTVWSSTGSFLYDDDACASLPLGSSWVTPEGVRIVASSGGLSSMQVQVDYGFGAARVPAAPTVTADASTPDKVTLGWDKPSDQGSIITRYEVERPDLGIVKVPTLGGEKRTATLDVAPGDHTGLRVRAVNRVGPGPWARSPGFTVSTVRPNVTVTTPADNATVSGTVPVGWTATSNATTHEELARVTLEVDGQEEYSDDVSGTDASGALTWYTTYAANGPHTIRVKAEDVAGRSTWSAPRAVTLANPVVVVDSPAAGATVKGTIPVTFHVTGAGPWSFTSGTVTFNGTDYPATQSGSTWTAQVDTRTDPNDTYVLVATLVDPDRGEVRKELQVTSANTMPTITVTGPTGTVTDPTQRVTFTTSVSWPWERFRAEVDGQVVGSTDPGSPLDVDLSGLASGAHTLKVYGEYGGFYEIASAGRSLTVSWPARTVTWGPGAPASGATVSGTVAVPYALSASWPWEQVCLQYYDTDAQSWWDTDCAQANEPLSWSTDFYPNGSYLVRLHSYDSGLNDYYSTSQRTWTLGN